MKDYNTIHMYTAEKLIHAKDRRVVIKIAVLIDKRVIVLVRTVQQQSGSATTSHNKSM